MKTHTNDYKKTLISGAREIDEVLRYFDNNNWITYMKKNLVSVKPILNTQLFKTTMKELDFESKTKLAKNTIVDFKNGLKVNDTYEYINYGEYTIYEIEDRPDTKTFLHICYDKMLRTMTSYEPLNVTYPISVENYIKAIATKCGLNFNNSNFANSNKLILKDYFSEGNYTYRDILDYLCELIGGWLYIDENENLNVKYPTETYEVFDEKYLNYINVTFEKKYGPVNSVVFARANELDNIEFKDDESITQNGLCRVKFSDNPFLSDTNRSEYLQETAQKIIGLEFYLNDLESKGITYLELGDIYSFKISDEYIKALKTGLVKAGLTKAMGTNKTKFKCLLINDEPEFKEGINEKIFTDEPLEDNSEYILTSPSENSLKNAEILVNKNAGELVLKANSDGQVVQARLDADADDGSLFEVKADNIKLEGYTTINNGFGVDLQGNMFANGGTFGGTINTSQDCTVGNNLYVGQNQATTNYDEKYIYFTNGSYIKRLLSGNTEILYLESKDFLKIKINGNEKFSCGGTNSSTEINSNTDIYLNAGRYIYETVQPTIISDARKKKNIKDINTSWIDELKVKEFEYKNSDDKQIGLIAQDYLDKDYSKYFLNEDDEGYYSIAYGNITNALIQYCQEMKQEINSLKEEIKQLKESDK